MAICVLVGIPVLFILFLTLIARLEKRMVWPYGTPVEEPSFAASYLELVYIGLRVGDAINSGFTFFGLAPDLKGARYKVDYALLVSPDRECFVVVSAGTVAGIEVRSTWIHSRGTDGRMFYTTDNQAAVEVDVSRQTRSHLVRAKDFATLLQRHKDLLRDRAVIVRPFAKGREIEDFRRMRQERFETMARRGFIAFTDHQETYWHYTVRGALKLAVLNFSIGLLRAITQGRIPRTA